MFNRKFWLDAADAFGVAVAITLVVDLESLVAVGSKEQAVAVGVAIGRSALIAGLRAVAPRFTGLRSS